MSVDDSIRAQLSKSLSWREAHAGFDAAVADLAPDLRARRVDPLPYSAWELVEHIRLTQFDILDFCVNTSYKERAWPADYWPTTSTAPAAAAWTESIAQYHRDRTTLQRLTENPAIDLLAAIPHGTGQTYLREILLVLDHTSYHVGQLVLLRRILGAWATP